MRRNRHREDERDEGSGRARREVAADHAREESGETDDSHGAPAALFSAAGPRLAIIRPLLALNDRPRERRADRLRLQFRS
jgi:ABC-type uncharacterized transport system YnjBCD ATPase subunit